MATAENRLSVTAGPSKFDLMLSLFEKGKTITFTVAGKPILVQVNGVSIEDGTRESWIVVGYIINSDPKQKSERFSAYFHTARRTGHFTITD